MAAKMAKVSDAGDDLIFKTSGDIEVPAEVLDRVRNFVDGYTASLEAKIEAYAQSMSGVKTEAGEPVLPGGYQYWNIMSLGPFQAFGPVGPYRPSKIIAAGELAWMSAAVAINPLPGPGGSLPGTTVLGSRPWRLRFETINLSTVSNGPDATFIGTFSGPAPILSVFTWFFVPGDPGINPNLYETNVTIDITNPAQPFAGFATWHFDPDLEPGFLTPVGPLPPVGPRLEHDIPARYLVYKKF
ncbi:MAG: hypothetical protein ACREEM_08715 [Blastocatellia bacterium]